MEQMYDASLEMTTQQHQNKIDRYRSRLKIAQEQTAAEKEKWKAKLDKLNEEMQSANDAIHNAKMNQRAIIQKHLDDTANAEKMLQNYVETLEEENDDLLLCRRVSSWKMKNLTHKLTASWPRLIR